MDRFVQYAVRRLMPGLLFCLVTVSTTSPLRGEVRSVNLPSDYADFAIQPETGTIATLSAETYEVFFFRQSELLAGNTTPVAKVRVGATPCEIFYKRYHDISVFAVVCTQDSHLYLIHAGGPESNPDEEFKLLKKIPIEQLGATSIAASINPDDPFLYYCYGSGHHSATGVVSLRDMQNHGEVFRGSMDCAFSASGEFAYRRGGFQPSGFESLIRMNKLTDDKPVFGRWFHLHESAAQYFPDPFDRFTASGMTIYSTGLERTEAGMDFLPLCFFRKRPVIVGVKCGPLQRDRHPPLAVRLAEDKTPGVTLRAASWNTLSKSGDDVVLTHEVPPGDRRLPRGEGIESDFRIVGKKARLFADDARDQVVFAEGSYLCFVPLADFRLPDEPLMLASIEGAASLTMGRESNLLVKLADDRAELTVNDTPEGMIVDGVNLKWTPQADQVGPAAVNITLKFQEIQSSLRLDMNVMLQRIPVPFSPLGMLVDDRGEKAVLWDGPAVDHDGLPIKSDIAKPTRIACIDLSTGRTIVERQVAEPIGSGILTDNFLFLRSTKRDSPKVDVLSISTLELEKSIVANGPVLHLDVRDKSLIIQIPERVEFYEMDSFRLRTSLEAQVRREFSLVNPQGIFVSGVLYEFDSTPKLIVNPVLLPAMNRNGPFPVIPQLRPEINPFVAKTRRNSATGSLPVGRLGVEPVPDAELQVSLDAQLAEVRIPRVSHSNRVNYELALTVSGSTDVRQVVVKQQLPSDYVAGSSLLSVAKRTAYVVHDNWLYRWPIPEAPAPAENQLSQPLLWQLRQSSLTLSDKETTELEHKVSGGRAPISYSLSNAPKGASIDSTTGLVTLNNELIQEEAMHALESYLKPKSRGTTLVQSMQSQAKELEARAAVFLGSEPTGFPVVLPVHVTASDADLSSSEIQYGVIVQIPREPFLERLAVLDKQQVAQKAKLQERRDAINNEKEMESDARSQTVPASAAELQEVKRKLQAMEERLDLMTRQLNMLLEKLDEQKQKQE